MLSETPCADPHAGCCGEGRLNSALRKQGLSARAIARAVGCHPSTICREVNRNRCNDGHYRPSKADSRTRTRRSNSRRNGHFDRRHFQRVEALMRTEQWSPEQISGYLRRTGEMHISHETIYLHVWANKAAGGDLYRHLRQAGKQRRKRYGAYDSRGRLAGKRHISERPKGVEGRRRFGHWEIDTVLGKGSKHCIVTVVERKSGYLMIGQLNARTTAELNARTAKLIARCPNRFKTITADNGTEFHGYAQLEQHTPVRFYFATPHHSWERGTNENTNGLIRQYLPKGESMAGLTQQRCNAIADKLNRRPRKRLGYRTPEECFYGN
ncbi:MAG: IS30 family transposase [Gammaproteobacteria bacterium]|nr:IS30 family transposase [Gammaproteobacteria bacterium]MCP5135910.1 IS30 family transposase [Gammaproteobacteria bacterium]